MKGLLTDQEAQEWLLERCQGGLRGGMSEGKETPSRSKPRGTGHPSRKDRSAHEAARGKKAQTLADLSRELPNEEEVAQLFTLMERESDRGCALVAGSFIEAAVYIALASKMAEDGDRLSPVFQGAGAPLASFIATIKVGLALQLYGPITAGRLSTIKDHRNAFAHALRPLDFSHPTIVAACKTLDDRPLPDAAEDLCPARIR